MHSYNKLIGNLGEELAIKYLKNNNYVILTKNFRTKLGEIDIIAKDENFICFIEVKSRYNNFYGYPKESITLKKQQKIYNVAKLYIMKKRLYKSNYNFRFDSIEVIFNKFNDFYKINLYKNSFYY